MQSARNNLIKKIRRKKSPNQRSSHEEADLDNNNDNDKCKQQNKIKIVKYEKD